MRDARSESIWAAVAALTVYDMCKALSHAIVIGPAKLVSKRGGKRNQRAHQITHRVPAHDSKQHTDEQWREHDRLNEKQLQTVESLEEQMSEVLDALQQMRENDANRMQAILALVRDLAAEYDQQFAKVK